MDGWGGALQRLAGLGAKVSVAARKFADLAWAESCGYGIEHTGQLEGWLCCYDLVVNTVPARILSEEDLEDLRPAAWSSTWPPSPAAWTWRRRRAWE